MKIEKSENQSAAHRVLRNIVGRTMALAMALTLSGVLDTAHATDTDSLPGLAVQPAEYFYTGKPYDTDLESYTFKYRNYNPELNRWTTVDPSGFPDGANNQYYAPVPTNEYDFWGLASRPLATDLWNAYPNYSTAAADVWAMAGGWLNDNFQNGDPNYQNSCALRLSIALNDSGNTIGAGAPGANLCEGERYIISATSMLSHIATEWGSADESLGAGGLSGLQSRLTGDMIAVVINGGHVGIVSDTYSDPHTPYATSGNMSVWILE